MAVDWYSLHPCHVCYNDKPYEPFWLCRFLLQKESYIKAYQPVIYGLNGPKMWPTTDNLPVQCPDFTKQRGRPKKSRNLQGDEVKKGGTLKLRKNYYVGRCGICGQRGHNKPMDTSQEQPPPCEVPPATSAMPSQPQPPSSAVPPSEFTTAPTTKKKRTD